MSEGETQNLVSKMKTPEAGKASSVPVFKTASFPEGVKNLQKLGEQLSGKPDLEQLMNFRHELSELRNIAGSQFEKITTIETSFQQYLEQFGVEPNNESETGTETPGGTEPETKPLAPTTPQDNQST